MPLLLFTIFVDFVGFGLIFPILPFQAQALGGDPSDVTLLIAVGAVAQMCSGTIWGRASDRFGRRRVLLSSLLLSTVAYAWFGFAHSLAALYVARVLTGATRGAVPVAQAWMADLTTPEQRAEAMGRIGGAIGLGFVVGPALGGLLAGYGRETPDYAVPCLAAAGLSLLNALLALRLAEPGRPAAAARPAVHFRFAHVRSSGFMLLATVFFITFAFSQVVAIFPLWAESRFAWGPVEVGYAFAGIGLAIALVQGGLLGRLVRRFGEVAVFGGGCALLACGLAAILAVVDPTSFAMQSLAVCFGYALCQPALTTLISKRGDPARQGRVMGAVGSAASSGRACGPLLSGFLYEEVGRNAPFLASALLIAVVAAGALASLRGAGRP